MTLYALHYQWIDDQSGPTPVGIWGEGGASFYPTEMQSHREDGWKAEIVASELVWAHWVKKIVEDHSPAGATLRAIESDEPMSTVLAEVQSKFFGPVEPAQRFVLA